MKQSLRPCSFETLAASPPYHFGFRLSCVRFRHLSWREFQLTGSVCRKPGAGGVGRKMWTERGRRHWLIVREQKITWRRLSTRVTSHWCRFCKQETINWAQTTRKSSWLPEQVPHANSTAVLTAETKLEESRWAPTKKKGLCRELGR